MVCAETEHTENSNKNKKKKRFGDVPHGFPDKQSVKANTPLNGLTRSAHEGQKTKYNITYFGPHNVPFRFRFWDFISFYRFDFSGFVAYGDFWIS